jgi:hypothetical protein
MSLEPGMTATFARSRAQGFRIGLATPMPWEERGRTARVNSDRCATKSHRILSFAGRGTGLDSGEGEFSPGGPRSHGADSWGYPLWLSAFPYGFKAFRPAIGRGSGTANKMRLFRVKPSHFVPFCPIHFCLFGACETCLMSPTAECRRARRARGTRL